MTPVDERITLSPVETRRRRRSMARWMLAGLVACALLGCAKTHQFTDTDNTVFELAASDPNLATFVSMAAKSGMMERLRADDPITVLAPNNNALDDLGQEHIRMLMNPEGSAELTELVKGFVFPGAFSAEDVARGKLPKNLLGDTISGSKATDGTARVSGTGKILVSMKGSNGYVHVVDVIVR
jgi:uncharacterized surface protein with fasciclin (FAS1) repeats